MMRHHVWPGAAGLVMALVSAGCSPQSDTPPQNLTQLRQHQTLRRKDYTGQTIALHNLRRVVDDELPPAERIESLKVVQKFDVDDQEARDVLSEALRQQKLPPAVRVAVVAYLGGAPPPPLVATPLADIVKQWASAAALTTRKELEFRQQAKRASGKEWDQALLEALNATAKFPRGSALEVLSQRLTGAALARRVGAMVPRTAAILTMQNFSRYFGYLPKTREELVACVIVARRGRQAMRSAGQLAGSWRAAHRYKFNIRDFPLLVALSSDPLRDASMSRLKLIPIVSRGIGTRRAAVGVGGSRRPRRAVFRRGRLVDFDSQLESLSTADLWNLYLLNEMLGRPRIRRMLGVAARQDRADRSTQWGGLISYESGKVEPRLHWPGQKQGDDRYVPSRAMLLSAPDSLMYFVGHFSRVATDAAWAGPNTEELKFAKAKSLYGVVFTSVGRNQINASYFNPKGIVVDLGDIRTP